MSDLESYQPDSPANWQFKSEMASDTLRQVEKDFALHGEKISISHQKLESYHTIVQALANEMARNHILESTRLAGIIYQIDLKESALQIDSKSVNQQLAYSFLADKILKRCFEKVYWRYKMRENS